MYRRLLISDSYKNELLYVLYTYNQLLLALKSGHFGENTVMFFVLAATL